MWILRILSFLLVFILAIDWGYARENPSSSIQSWQIQGILTALDDSIPLVRAEALKKAVEANIEGQNFLEIIPEDRIGKLREMLLFKSENVLETGEVRAAAARAFGRMGEITRDHTFLLIECLKLSYFNVTQATVEAFWELGEIAKEQVPQLVEMFQNPKMAGTGAGNALAGMGEEAIGEYIPTFVALLRSSDCSVRLGALVILGGLGTASRDYAPEISRLLSNTNLSINHRVAAAYTLIKMGEATSQNLFELLPELQGSNDDRRIAAMKTIGQMGELARPLAPKLVELLEHPESHSRRGAAWALGAMEEVAKDQIPNIMRLLDDPNPDTRESPTIREAAALALRLMGDVTQELIPQLVPLLASPEPSLRAAAVSILGGMGKAAKDQIPKMIPLLDDSNSNVRKTAKEALEEMGETVGDYAPLIATRLPQISALTIFGTMGEAAKDYTIDIARSLVHPKAEIRRFAQRTLVKMGNIAKEQIPYFVQLLDDPRWQVRIAATEILGRMGETAKDQVPQITRLLKDSSSDVRIEAALALARIGISAKDYAPQIIAQLQWQSSSILQYPDGVLNQTKSITNALDNLGALDRQSVLPILNTTYIHPKATPQLRFLAYYLCSTDPEAVTLIHWLGKPLKSPQIDSRTQAREILQLFAEIWQQSESYVPLRRDLATQITKLCSQWEWKNEDFALLQTHYQNLKQANFSEAEILLEILNRFSWQQKIWQALSRFFA